MFWFLSTLVWDETITLDRLQSTPRRPQTAAETLDAAAAQGGLARDPELDLSVEVVEVADRPARRGGDANKDGTGGSGSEGKSRLAKFVVPLAGLNPLRQ